MKKTERERKDFWFMFSKSSLKVFCLSYLRWVLYVQVLCAPLPLWAFLLWSQEDECRDHRWLAWLRAQALEFVLGFMFWLCDWAIYLSKPQLILQYREDAFSHLTNIYQIYQTPATCWATLSAHVFVLRIKWENECKTLRTVTINNGHYNLLRIYCNS